MEEMQVTPPPGEKKKLSVNCSLREIEDEFGLGMFLYFDFLRFIFIFNLVIVSIMLVNWVPHVVSRRGLSDGLDAVFVSGYDPSSYARWLITTSVAFGLALVMGWLFPLRVRHIVASRDTSGISGQDLWEADSMNILPEQMGMIERNLRLTNLSRGLRIAASWMLFVLVMALCVGIMALIVFRQVWKVDLEQWIPDTRIYYYTPITWWDFVAAAVLNILDFLGKRFAGWLTHLERHKRRLTHSENKTIKLFLFKVVLVSSLYVSQRVAAIIHRDQRECPMRPEAIKFLTIIISDITIGNLLTWAVPLTRTVKDWYRKRKGKPVKPIQFDLANEHMEVMYRQYILYLGMSVFPLISVFVLATNLIEYPLDKMRLVIFSRETKKVTGTPGLYIAFFLSFMAILGFVVWPDGGLYALAGQFVQRGFYCPCTIYSNRLNCSSLVNESSSF